jgi:hypothetical protein
MPRGKTAGTLNPWPRPWAAPGAGSSVARVRFLIRDRDTKYPTLIDEILICRAANDIRSPGRSAMNS